MTNERERLEAAIAERDAANERDRARLKAMDAEPDWQAWRPALQAFYVAKVGKDICGRRLDETDKSNIRGLQAAIPLAPADPVDDEAVAVIGKDWSLLWASADSLSEIVGRTGIAIGTRLYARTEAITVSEDAEELADKAAWQAWPASHDYPERDSFRDGYIAAIRATLQRGARWPGDAETIVPEVGSWVTWHGGECPVPAGTRVEVRFRDGGQDADRTADDWVWESHCGPLGIIAYRILGAAS